MASTFYLPAIKIILNSWKTKRGGTVMKNGNKNLVVLVVCLLGICVGAYGKSNEKKYTSSSYSSNYSSNYSGGGIISYSSSSKPCLAGGCTRSRMNGGLYCSKHTCIKSGCNGKVESGSSYCYSHMPSTTSSSTPSYHNNSGNTNQYDPYDVYDYDNGDDFAEEWAEEFGDGDYEDGYDEAYDYWEDEMEE